MERFEPSIQFCVLNLQHTENGRELMRVFQVRQTRTGAILWVGEAPSREQALDCMAHAAGYMDFAHMPSQACGGDLQVEAISL